MSNTLKWGIALLMAATIFRTQTVLFLGSVQVFGGPASDAWLAPWLSDAALGVMVPVMLFLFWTQRCPRVWGILVAYNAVGAFDYAHGLLTQFSFPMPSQMASATTVYLGIGVFLMCQLIALRLLFRDAVVHHFWARDSETA